jgi:Domain of unknown function(DUF2779)
MSSALPKAFSLSKSRVLAGLQCHKRLYLQLTAPTLATAPDAALEFLFAQGHEVGQIAQQAFPGGVVLEAGRERLDEALARTAALVRDPAVPAIFEATFRHDDVLVRVDVLARAGGDRWRLIEVKSAAGVKQHYLQDVAIQRHVLAGCGVDVESAAVMHVSRDYVHAGGGPDPARLFAIVDVTAEVRALEGELPRLLAAMRAALAGDGPPAIATGEQCARPYLCEFYDHCHIALSAAGTAGHARFAEGLREELAGLTYPLGFMDFETLGPAIPRYPGMRPHDAIPFQWSLHTVRAPGAAPEHAEFLPTDAGDPRRRFLESLVKAAGETGSLVVYSGFEGRQLDQLAAWFPDLAPGVERLRARLWDLLPVMRRHVEHPGFLGSFSLKRVLPVLIPTLGYDDLEVAEGLAAGPVWDRLVRGLADGTLDAAEAARLETALRAYCRQDTLAMVELVRELARGVGVSLV